MLSTLLCVLLVWTAVGQPQPFGNPTIINAINSRRCLHGVPDIQWNADVADRLRGECTSQENHQRIVFIANTKRHIYYTDSSDPSIDNVLRVWYDNPKSTFNYGAVDYSSLDEGSKPFASVVWKGLTSVGCTLCAVPWEPRYEVRCGFISSSGYGGPLSMNVFQPVRLRCSAGTSPSPSPLPRRSPRCGRYYNVDQAGGWSSLAELTVSSDGQCNKACLDDSRCVYWVVRLSTGTCWLSSTAPTQFKYAEDRTIGPRCGENCPTYYNVDQSAGWSQLALLTAFTLDECNELCRGDSRCVYWIWGPSNKLCSLSSTRPTQVKYAADRVTGPRCEGTSPSPSPLPRRSPSTSPSPSPLPRRSPSTSPSPSPLPRRSPNTLGNNQALTASLTSDNGVYTAVVQNDGNFVVYQGTAAVWSSGTNNRGVGPYRVVMQNDGNLVLYDSTNRALWSSGTSGKGQAPYTLVMQNDRNLVVYDASKAAIWTSITAGTSPSPSPLPRRSPSTSPSPSPLPRRSPRCGRYYNVDQAGGWSSLAELTVSSDGQCNKACLDDSRCVYWVVRLSTGTCWLSSTAPTQFKYAEDRTIGPRCGENCPTYYNVDQSAGWSQLALLTAFTLDECNELCRGDSRCVYWIWGPSNKLCSLSSTRPTQVKYAADRVTGPRCEGSQQ